MKFIEIDLLISLLSVIVLMMHIKGGNFRKRVKMMKKKMMIKQTVCRNLENKVGRIFSPLEKTNLLICQNIFRKEKMKVLIKIIKIEIKNTTNTTIMRIHEKIIQKFVNKEELKEVMTLIMAKEQKNQKILIKIKACNQSQ